MRRNGFTLIELLAVIVILAIIALIATPIILGIINDAREKANERSVELYASAVRNGIAAYQLTGTEAPKSFSNLTIQYDGDVKCTVQELYEDGSFYLEGCTVNGSEKEYSYGTKQGSDAVKLCTANTAKATALIYYDKEKGIMDESAYRVEEVGLLASDGNPYTPGVTYTCNFIDANEDNHITFFVLSSTEKDVTLIADSNLGGTVAWSEDGNNHANDPEELQAVTAKAALADRTSTWNKLTEEQKSTIKLPTKDQIESAYEGTIPSWLVANNANYRIPYGYWTSTPSGSDYVVYVSPIGISGDPIAGLDGYYGIRPVITLSKSAIN